MYVLSQTVEMEGCVCACAYANHQVCTCVCVCERVCVFGISVILP